VVTLERGVFCTVLSSKPMAYLGRISYGVYLFHVPATQVVFRVFPGQETFPLDFLLTVAVAALSFHFVEKPVMEYARMRIEQSQWRQCRNCGERKLKAVMHRDTSYGWFCDLEGFEEYLENAEGRLSVALLRSRQS
jgi:peptidoglycan/LPS O-acetylase OafA/YrhL